MNYSLKLILFIAALFLVLPLKSAQAQDRARVRFETLEEIPPIYTQKVYNQDSLEKFTRRVLTDVRVKLGKFDHFIVKDWNRYFKNERDKLKYNARSEQLKYDFNFDGIVTLEERLMEYVNRWNMNNAEYVTIETAKNNNNWVRGSEREIEKLDINKNGQIDFDEMVFVSKDEIKNLQYRVKESLYAYANCDFNGDGKITEAELKAGARAAFHVFDADRDKKINENEVRKIKKKNKSKR
jgi:Ca2+-binding EF-hand superfamily protein